MKKLILCILCIFMCLSFVACSVSVTQDYEKGELPESEVETTARFVRVYKQIDDTCNRLEIYVDTETSIMYLLSKDGYGAGLTVMLDEDGKPMKWEEET